MAHTYRFFIPPEQLTLGLVPLSPEEAHHAIHVARLRPGTQVEAFDGVGTIAVCEVREAGKRDAVLEVLTIDKEAEARRRLTLCVAFPNRDRTMERIIESCVPLGVTDFLIFASDHSEREPVVSSKWERWSREACKQCSRAWAPRFSAASGLESAISACDNSLLIVLSPDASATILPEVLDRVEACTCLIGPEGGLSAREHALARAGGAVSVSLGAHILRSELACSTAAALITYRWRVIDTAS